MKDILSYLIIPIAFNLIFLAVISITLIKKYKGMRSEAMALFYIGNMVLGFIFGVALLCGFGFYLINII